jgi:23S rRNA (adenine2503-C2)-methyltransferase
VKLIKFRTFKNGVVYLLKTDDGYPVEVTDTFLPYETKNAVGRKKNTAKTYGSRFDRFMIGVSVMSGCPMRCKFCATGKLNRYRNLTAAEIIEQVEFVLGRNKHNPNNSKEFKINYTRMGDWALNQTAVRHAISELTERYKNTHHYVSTVGIKGMNTVWIKDNITLQLSLHSLSDEKRDWLIPNKRKMSIAELGQVKTESRLKTTLNMTLVNPEDFDISKLKETFSPENFFIKLSPLNENCVSDMNKLKGMVPQNNSI